MTSEIKREFIADFVAEAHGYLPQIRQALADLEKDPAHKDAAELAHRIAHTIKGAAAMVGFSEISHTACQLEEYLENCATDTRAPGPAAMVLLDQLVKLINSQEQHCRGTETVGETSSVSKPDLVEQTIDKPIDSQEHHLSGSELIGESPAASRLESLDHLPSLPTSDVPVGSDADLFAEYSAVPACTTANLPPLLESDLATVSQVSEPKLADASSPVHSQLAPSSFDGDQPQEASPELLEVFQLEAEDHLRSIQAALPLLENRPEDRELLQEIRRSAHTLKGSAAMVGLRTITQLAHRMEDLLDLLYAAVRPVTFNEIQLLFTTTDILQDLASGKPPPQSQLAEVYDRFTELLGDKAVDTPAGAQAIHSAERDAATTDTVDNDLATSHKVSRFVRIPIERLDELVKLVSEVAIARAAFEQRMTDFLRQVNELQLSTERLRRASYKLETQYEARTLAGRPVADDGPINRLLSSFRSHGFDDLEFDRYTDFHLLTRELAETTSDIQTVNSELHHLFSDFESHLARQARQASEIEDKLMRLRMVPLSTLASRLHRTVRSVAKQQNKQIELVLEGETTELDKTVLEEMADPLLHLLRNAVDHGIEAPELRQAKGKPVKGVIRFSACHEGNQVILQISDDGAGIDLQLIRDLAISRGLVEATNAAGLSKEALYDLLYLPGFSTTRVVSEISGRGVGLDVVKSQVQKLKGTIALNSEPGQGTTFTIRLPLTLAITRALLVRAHQQTFALPLDSVRQILRLENNELERIGHEPVLRVTGEVYPVLFLGQVLGLREPAESADRFPALILNTGDRQVALIVDRLLGGKKIVVKNLGNHLRRVRGILGATLMGDGSVVLIVNPSDLGCTTTDVKSPTRLPNQSRTQSVAQVSDESLTVLVVDDSPSVRRVISNLLKSVGWQAITAKDGLEALQLLHRSPKPPDLVLLDIEMPRMDGYELLASLRGQDAYQSLPVVMITSRAGEKHRRKALDLGASAYLVKPYQDEDLLRIIRSLVQKTRQAVMQ
jgi:chemosensory pili system protein ChpA (sensor histidine kinase/response regulator)